MKITTIGLDIAKNVFQVHGIDAVRALPRCLIGIEACATSHCWARELTKLGYQVRLMPAKDVKAYVSAGATCGRSCRDSRRRPLGRLPS
jgi:transposase